MIYSINMEVDSDLDPDPPPDPPPDDIPLEEIFPLPSPASELQLLQGGEQRVTNQAYEQDSVNHNSLTDVTEDQEPTAQGPPTQLVFINSHVDEKIIQEVNGVKKGAERLINTPHTITFKIGSKNPFAPEAEPQTTSPCSPGEIHITGEIVAESTSPVMDKEDDAQSKSNVYSDDFNGPKDIRYDTNSKYYTGEQSKLKPSNSHSASSDSALETPIVSKEERRKMKNKNSRNRKRQREREEKLAKRASSSVSSPLDSIIIPRLI